MLNDSEIDPWMTVQEWKDLRPLLSASNAYVHPYGFVVFRLRDVEIQGWNARVHVWPPADEISAWAVRNVSSIMIHSHVWDMRTRTVVGAVRHSRFTGRTEAGGRVAYEATSDFLAGSSYLRRIDEPISVALAETVVADAGPGILRLERDTFHLTVPALDQWSVTLAVVQDAPQGLDAAASLVLADEDLGQRFENPRRPVDPSLRFLNEVDRLAGADTADDEWVAFALLEVDERYAMVRTYRYPHSWSFLGGQRDPRDRSPRETLERELREEANLSVDVAGAEQLVVVPKDVGNGLMHVWRVSLPDTPALDLQEDEIIELGWFTRQQMAELPTMSGVRAAIDAL